MNAFHYSRCLAVITLLALYLLSCAGLKRDYPDKQFFVVEATRDHKESPEPAAPRLEIGNFQISSGFKDRAMVYRTGQYEYRTDFYNNYFQFPDRMIERQCTQWLEASGLFSLVTHRQGLVEPGFILEGSILEMYGDYRPERSPEAVLELEFTLLENPPAEHRLMFETNYARRTPMSNSGARKLAEGLSEALEDILFALEEDLRRATGAQ
jgi:cholesterol transport system auxiliary component